MSFKVKQSDDVQIRPRMRLGEVERLIRKHRILLPPPSRPTLIGFCEDGTFKGAYKSRIGWLVFEDTFWEWARELNEAGGSTDPAS